MNLKQLINQSVYGTIGYISSQDDLDLLEQYIVYNLPVLKEYKQIVAATNYGSELQNENTQLWKKYFPECIILDSPINRGHGLGTADLDNMVFDYCKENNEEWLCKLSNDVILQESILDKQIEEADFYYLNGIGYGGMEYFYQFDLDKIIENDFYPQTNFHFINVSKSDYLNNKSHLDEIYNIVKDINTPNPELQGFRGCENSLKDCVERNNLSKYHLIPKEKYVYLLNMIKDYQIHDPSHKNIMIEGICHFQFPNQQIIQI